MARIKASKKRTTEQVEADEQQAAKDKRAKASAQFVHGLFGLDGLTAVVIGGEGVLGGAIA